MRLTLVISTLGRGGAERVMSVLASAWAREGKEVTLVKFDTETPSYPVDSSVKIRSLGLTSNSRNLVEGLIRNIHRVSVLRQAIRESQPDVVVSFMDCMNILTLLATRRLRKPIIISERTDPARYKIGAIWSCLRKLLYPLADALVCPTGASVVKFQSMTKVWGIAIANPVTVSPSLDGSRLRVSGASRSNRLVAVGRLVRQKGFDLLLEAFARIAQCHPEWAITILGQGPLRNELEAQADALGLAGRVYFAGEVPDPYSMFRDADLFVSASRFEGFGMALAEAMACGLPVISFDCPEGPGTIIRDGVDGILVPPENVAALAAAMDRLMSDPKERQRLSARAPEVLERFSTDKALLLWQTVFDTLRQTTTTTTERGLRLDQAKDINPAIRS
jgi:GalNAc-alpha-(1->4)-GalNAc-alpha-(1->3)-diNAcBac-PP-undecaprenol alpha-1,4-N-acetyl-D-galactosaminyltransferase